MSELNLGQNQLTGEIPREIWNLTDLDYLCLNGNLLEGEISLEDFSVSNLRELNQYQGGMYISWVLKTTERTPKDLASPLGLKWAATDSEV